MAIDNFPDIFQPLSDKELKNRFQIAIQKEVDKCTKNSDGTYSCNGNLDLSRSQLIKFPVRFKDVKGNFYCDHNQLISLEGAPEKVSGNFSCYYNQLISLEGAPEKVGGDFSCDHNQLISLEGVPETVDGNFYCGYNQLTSLEGAPETVSGDFYCSHNFLSSKQLKLTIKRNYLKEAVDPDLFQPESEEELEQRPITYDMIMYAFNDYIIQNKLSKLPYQTTIRVKKKHLLAFLKNRFGRWSDQFTPRVLKIAKQWDLRVVEAIEPSLFQPASREEKDKRGINAWPKKLVTLVSLWMDEDNEQLVSEPMGDKKPYLVAGDVLVHGFTFTSFLNSASYRRCDVKGIPSHVSAILPFSAIRPDWFMMSDEIVEAVDLSLFQPFSLEEHYARTGRKPWPLSVRAKKNIYLHSDGRYTDVEVPMKTQHYPSFKKFMVYTLKTVFSELWASYVDDGGINQIISLSKIIKPEWFQALPVEESYVEEAKEFPDIFQPVGSEELAVRHKGQSKEKQAKRFGWNIIDQYWHELHQPRDDQMDAYALMVHFSAIIWNMRQELFDAQLAVDYIYAYQEDSGLFLSSEFKKALTMIVKDNHKHLHQVEIVVNEVKEFLEIFKV